MVINRIKTKVKKITLLSKRSGKSVLSLLRDYFTLKDKLNISFNEYENYRLYERKESFRNRFLSYSMAEKYWLLLNPSYYACLARDKYLSHCLLVSAGIPTAKLIAYYNPEAATSSSLIVNEYDQIKSILQRTGRTSFVIKPARDSAHGNGVIVCRSLEEQNGELIVNKYDGSKYLLRDLLGRIPLLFEEVVVQTDQLRSMNDSSVNTVRIMTALYPDKSVRVIAAFMKIGRKGADIDNAGSGGNIDCGINIETGKLYNVVEFNSWTDIKKISYHPDSKTLISGEIIKDWNIIIEKIKYYQGLLPQLKVIGWDVALTENGPVIIEINNWWDTTGQEFIDNGWAPQVAECYGAWEKYYCDKET